MKISDYPILLVTKRFLLPIQESLEKVHQIEDSLTEDLSLVLVHGAFVMGVAHMEVALSDSLIYYLTRFPQKMSKDDFRFSKEEFIENHFRLIHMTAEKYVNTLSYRSFRDFHSKYYEICSLEWDIQNQELLDEIQEINATRNLLLHNKLVVNDLYIEQAGSKSRSQNRDERLKADFKYVRDALSKICRFMENLCDEISLKYSNFTKIEANKRLWAFMFDTPVMPYDDFWDYNLEKDKIIAYKRGKYEGTISSTELLRLGLWRAHFNGDCQYLQGFRMRAFDNNVNEKVLFFLSIASDFNFY